MELCIAKPNVLRCIWCFVFPFAMLGWYVYAIGPVGHDIPSYLSAAASGARNQASIVLFGAASAWWIVLTWPKAIAALRTRGCAIGVDDQRLLLYGERINRSEIVSTNVVRHLLHLEVRILLKDGSTVRRSIALLSPSPDSILECLRAQGL